MKSFSRQLHSSAAEVEALVDALEDWFDVQGIDIKAARYIGLMLDELVANIVVHAYGGRNDGRIEVAADYDGRAVAVTLRDYGPAFDPTALAPADTALDIEERGIGGLGVHFVRRLADRFTYRRDGAANEVVFSKATGQEQSA